MTAFRQTNVSARRAIAPAARELAGILLLAAALSWAGLAGAAPGADEAAPPGAVSAISLEQLQNTTSPYYSSAKAGAAGKSGNFRLDAVRNAALGVGVRGGLKARTDEMNAALERVQREMDVAYDFRAYLIDGRVLPPVITESRDLYSQGSDTALRLAGRSYQIEAQARFVSRPPNWREYMLVKYEKVPMPSAALLPTSSEEEAVWKTAVAEGWKQGVAQADAVFELNFNRLNRDLIGVVRFHKLVASNMVTLPVIAQSWLPVVGDKTSMSMDEQMLRITVLPSFNLSYSEWAAAPGKIQTPPAPLPRPKGENPVRSNDADVTY